MVINAEQFSHSWWGDLRQKDVVLQNDAVNTMDGCEQWGNF